MKVFDKFREKRQRVYENLFSARALFVTGFLIMPVILFISTPMRIYLFLLFWFLAWLCGKRNNPLITISIILVIVIFNLTVPVGQVLFTIGNFRVTGGALMLGIHRAVTLAALIMLSRITIRHDLKIPGLFGELIGESLRLFSVIMNQRQRITRKNLIGDIDQMMVDLSNDSGGDPKAAKAPAKRTKPLGFVLLALLVLIAWFPWILRFWFFVIRPWYFSLLFG